MTRDAYLPTAEQEAIIGHDGHAFVRACPGAGKTRTMVERARHLLFRSVDRRGVAFLSFTNAAVEELEARLRSFGALPSPLFPSFIGTFDRFLWQFLVVPFGVDGFSQPPTLVPNKGEWEVKPWDNTRAFKLKYFNRATGTVLPDKAVGAGFKSKDWPVRGRRRRAELSRAPALRGKWTLKTFVTVSPHDSQTESSRHASALHCAAGFAKSSSTRLRTATRVIWT